MTRYYILFKKWDGNLPVKGSGHCLSSDLTGLTLPNLGDRKYSGEEEPMYFPTRESALLIANRFLEKGLPPGWNVTVETEEETDFIVDIYDREIQMLCKLLDNYRKN